MQTAAPAAFLRIPTHISCQRGCCILQVPLVMPHFEKSSLAEATPLLVLGMLTGLQNIHVAAVV